jgi:hypothetical protein
MGAGEGCPDSRHAKRSRRDYPQQGRAPWRPATRPPSKQHQVKRTIDIIALAWLDVPALRSIIAWLRGDRPSYRQQIRDPQIVVAIAAELEAAEPAAKKTKR